MEKKIKILQSVSSLGIGGNVIFVMNFFRHIDKEKFQVDFVIYDDEKMDFYDEVTKSGSRVYVCKSNKKNKILKLLDEMRQVKKLLKKEHYHIIHSNSCSFIGIFRGIIPAKTVKGIKVISHSHSAGIQKKDILNSWFRNMLKMITCLCIDMGFSCSDLAGESKYTKKFMKSSKYVEIRNAINTNKYKFDSCIRKSIREKLDINDKTFVIGHVGRIEYEKNHKFMISILKNIINKGEDVKLLLIGDGSLKCEVEQEAIKERVYDKIIFLGRKENAFEFYNAMDCFILPSLYEGFPFVMVEAQVNGLKCIISDKITKSVNIADSVKFVSLQKDASEWADIVLDYGKNRMSDNQVKKVCDLYDLKNEARRLEQLYIRTLM